MRFSSLLARVSVARTPRSSSPSAVAGVVCKGLGVRASSAGFGASVGGGSGLGGSARGSRGGAGRGRGGAVRGGSGVGSGGGGGGASTSVDSISRSGGGGTASGASGIVGVAFACTRAHPEQASRQQPAITGQNSGRTREYGFIEMRLLLHRPRTTATVLAPIGALTAHCSLLTETMPAAAAP